MEKYMTYAEIKSAFDSEWVLLGGTKTKKNLEILGGTVICHGKDKKEVFRKAKELHPKDMAVFFTGGLPKGTAVVL